MALVSTYDCKFFNDSNAPTHALWLHNSIFDVLVPPSNEIALTSKREESLPRCPRVFCAHACALGDECAARASSARPRRYAAYCVACSNRSAVTSHSFFSRGLLRDKLARRSDQRISCQLHGSRTRAEALEPAKQPHFPHKRRDRP